MTLYKNGASAGVSCNIAAGQSSCTISGAACRVNGSDTIVLVVSRTSGSGTSYTGTGNGDGSHERSVEQRQLVHVGLRQLREPDVGELQHHPERRNDHRGVVQLRLGDRQQLLVLGHALQERLVHRLELHHRQQPDGLHDQRRRASR